MATMTKHVGEYGGKPCVVLFREVPNEPENCLVVMSGSLDPSEHDVLMNVVTSSEGQQANEINEVFNRRQFSDGSNMLTTLHYNKKIQKVPVSMVNLVPVPGQKISLADVNAELKKIQNPNQLKTDAPVAQDITAPKTKTVLNTDGTAQSLLVQGQLMKEDAERMLAEAEAKIKEAYKLDPELKKAAKK